MTTVLDLPLVDLAADDGGEFPVDDPATGDTITTVPRMGAAETERALRAAEDALPAWRGRLAKERAGILRRWADLMLENEERLARLLTTEQGKPIAESRVEVAYAASFLEWFGEEGKRVYGDTIPTYLPTGASSSRRSRSASPPASRRGTSRPRCRLGKLRRRSRRAARWC